MIRLIAAIDTSRGIATDKGIPWKLPGDTAYFENQTTTGLIIMGWATYNEFSAPLHGRDNYVLTRDSESPRSGFRPITTLADLMESHPKEDVWVIEGPSSTQRPSTRATSSSSLRFSETFIAHGSFPTITGIHQVQQSNDQEEAAFTTDSRNGDGTSNVGPGPETRKHIHRDDQ